MTKSATERAEAQQWAEYVQYLENEIEKLRGHKEEADRHIKTIAELRREKERLYDEVKQLNAALDEIIALAHYPDADIARKAREP